MLSIFDDGPPAARPLWRRSPAPPIAHTTNQTGACHSWADHALEVGRIAGDFGAKWGLRNFMTLAGIVHDCGKLSEDVQERLTDRARTGSKAPLGVDHKFEGAAMCLLFLDKGDAISARVLASVVFGHHGGLIGEGALKDAVLFRAHQEGASLVSEYIEETRALTGVDLEELVDKAAIPPDLYRTGGALDRMRLEHLTRMLHSALVDADFLDTAAHFTDSLPARYDEGPSMETLSETFDQYYAERFSGAVATPLNDLRRRYYDLCVASGDAVQPSFSRRGGIFRLPAPTGCGKTLAAAAFALHHATTHGKSRVVVAVPFTTITAQNAAVYREAFAKLGPEVVLEHHSNLIDDEIADNTWRRLHADNWDAHFIVTTTVQLFESLFAARPSATRKLHRLTDAVVVLDEIQALPPLLLPAILAMMRQLAADYGTTFLLASATQPPLWSIPEWQAAATDPDDPAHPHDLIDVHAPPPPETLRVRFEIAEGRPDWPDVAVMAARHRQALLIVNTTSNAQSLHKELRSVVSAPVFHLSSRMHAQHKRETLALVTGLLGRGEPVYLVSTQLIEAGVDISFPVVFRALAPAEAIVQSAGRCNREGTLAEPGLVVVFEPVDGGLPDGFYRDGTATTSDFFVTRGRSFDDPTALTDYYTELLGRQLQHGTWEEIRDSRKSLNFPGTQALFKMIKDASINVIVDQGAAAEESQALQDALRRAALDIPLSRSDRRLLDKYTARAPGEVARRPDLVEMLGRSGIARWIGVYDEAVGLVLNSTEASIW